MYQTSRVFINPVTIKCYMIHSCTVQPKGHHEEHPLDPQSRPFGCPLMPAEGWTAIQSKKSLRRPLIPPEETKHYRPGQSRTPSEEFRGLRVPLGGMRCPPEEKTSLQRRPITLEGTKKLPVWTAAHPFGGPRTPLEVCNPSGGEQKKPRSRSFGVRQGRG